MQGQTLWDTLTFCPAGKWLLWIAARRRNPGVRVASVTIGTDSQQALRLTLCPTGDEDTSWYRQIPGPARALPGSVDLPVHGWWTPPVGTMDRNLRNMLVVSFGFLLLFTAFGGLQNLQVRVHTRSCGLGLREPLWSL